MLSGARPAFPPRRADTGCAGGPGFGRAESKHPYAAEERCGTIGVLRLASLAQDDNSNDFAPDCT